jgi:8-amino-7-oxononanoate synthase
MAQGWNDRLAEALAAAERRGERRRLLPARLMAGGRVQRGGRTLIDFSSNDYLGLATHPLLAERGTEWARAHGSGAGASRLVTGTHDLHLAVEARVAAFKGTEAALLFASGWQANAAIIPALARAVPGLRVFADRLNHASLHQGIAAAGLRQHRFRHNDLDHLPELLRARGDGPSLIVTESVFSMDGDRADLPALTALARDHDAFLYVDEAHATGVLGPGGAGLSATVPGSVDLAMGTFSKAMGSFGAYVAGSRTLCDYLVNACSGLIYSTALPPFLLGAIDAALDLMPAMDAERAQLAARADYLRQRLAALQHQTGPSSTQIVPVMIGDPVDALDRQRALEQTGFLAAAIRPPTVPRGTSRLRLALRVGHDESMLDDLVDALGPA